MRTEALPLVASLVLAGCVSAPGESSAGLAGTQWGLVSFVSMDDAVGRLVPAQEQTFSIAFNTDGQAALRLDCNRGTASYAATPSSASSGRLEFGPVAATRAMCPEPRIGDLMVSELPNVASYTLQGGTLSLALKMDGGVFMFEPAE